MGLERRQVRVTGTVQGVGFRPFVHHSAVALGLTGFVRNDSQGVLLEVEGSGSAVDELCRRLAEDPPALARVTSVVARSLPPLGDARPFRIDTSRGGGAATAAVSADAATCDACLAEVDDPSDRRFGYPFTSCTSCGPRYTITLGVPYDRATTTMASFAMCEACHAEYHDPYDRRFHAQPNCCPECGPALCWRSPDGTAVAEGPVALAAAAALLGGGGIAAVKGLGGYHLSTDATDATAVARLRRRKRRDDKPFAVLVADVAAAHELCVLDAAAEAALRSSARPIVLAPHRPGSPVADEVAPGLAELGLLLAYTPLHHLLANAVGRPLVLTSGNVSDEPIAHLDADAVERLGPLVDGLLTSNRPIHVRCDDSVVRAAAGRVTVLRRSRGHAPEPLRLVRPAARPVLAVGAELKSTVAVASGDSVVASHHIGDLEHPAAYRSFLEAVDHLCALTGTRPEVVAHDLHPEYLSTKLAMDLALTDVAVQHHHAHVAACLVDNGRVGPVLGLAFDGLGLGDDGALWGGELLVADLTGYERVGHLRPVPLPGGANAIREPWRMAVSWLCHGVGAERARREGQALDARSSAVVDLVERGAAPMTSSVGRLFDAVAALLGVRSCVTYEGQAAVELEALARSVPLGTAPAYPVALERTDGPLVLDPAPLVAAVLVDRDRGVDRRLVAAGFHEGIGRAGAEAAVVLARQRGLDSVALTGGVFQNARLTEVVETALRAAGLEVLVHRSVPANDGGISIGQAAVAAARGAEGGKPTY